MAKFLVKIVKTEITNYSFSLIAKDENTAEEKINMLLSKLNYEGMSVGKEWEEELEDCSYELDEIEEEEE